MNRPHLARAHAQALARQDLSFFARGAIRQLLPAIDLKWNWHLDLIANRLEDVINGQTRRLIINVPPRSGKSLIASVALPAFLLGHDSHQEIINASYSRDLSLKMASDTRVLMNSTWYQSLFSTRLVSRRARLSELRTTAGGTRLATSVDGQLTGRGGNIILIDDPIKPGEAISDAQRKAVNQWYDNTVPTRINDKELGAIIVIMQRLHEDDLVGHLLAKGHWDQLVLPAVAEHDEVHEIRTPFGSRQIVRQTGEPLHPERESIGRIEEMRLEMGSYLFAAQYQQRPAPAGGGLVRLDWFGRFNLLECPKFKYVIQSWDTASKTNEMADYSVCTTWGICADNNILLIHVFRARLDFPDLRKKIIELADQYRPSCVLIEEASSGVQFIQDLRHSNLNIIAIKVQGEKVMRMRNQTARIEAGKVWIPDSAPWLAEFESEVEQFPQSRYKDQVDSMSQALAYVAKGLNGAEAWIDHISREVLEIYGLTSADLTVQFDHPEKYREFRSNLGRTVLREQGGYYQVTQSEWEEIKAMPDVSLVNEIG